MENKSLLYPCASAARRVISLDGMWRFEFDPESNGMDAGWGVGLPKPISMPVPASFCDFFTDKESREYCGDFWYETDFFRVNGAAKMLPSASVLSPTAPACL